MATRKKAPVTSHVERDERTVDEIEGLVKGDPVKVKGTKGLYNFCYATLDSTGAPESYTVYGGTSGHGALRAFRPERITPDKATKRLRKAQG